MKNGSIKLLRYPGGKQRLLEFLHKYLPEREEIKGRLIEPFVGGAAVFFAINPKKALLTDLNSELVDLYNGIKKDPEAVWSLYMSFPATKEDYYDIRDSDISEQDDLILKAARTLYLNRTCFKGMWRYNSEGVFNIGYGGEDRRDAVSNEMLIEVSKRLGNAEVRVSDFEKVIEEAEPQDFIFLDPPYKPGEKSLDHAHYVYGKFTYEDHERLANSLKKADEKGVKWAMTTSSHKDILSLFDSWGIIRIPKGTGERIGILTDNSGEVLIHNY